MEMAMMATFSAKERGKEEADGGRKRERIIGPE
jgi:hypothetical protein